MKILFVEDELEKNIPRLLRLFKKYLYKPQRQELKALEDDPSGYGATPEQIKEIVERNDIIRVAYRFPDALKEILDHYQQYALFIIDRNLSLSDYDYEEANQLDPLFTDAQYNKFFEREGDYLLKKMSHLPDFKTMFYFLTAYSYDDEIRGKEDIQDLIDFDRLRAENFIDKSNPDEINRLQNIIETQPMLIIQNENQKYLEILKRRIGEDASVMSFMI